MPLALRCRSRPSFDFIDSIGTADSDVEDDINGSTVSGGRVSMLFKPSEAFSLLHDIVSVDAAAGTGTGGMSNASSSLAPSVSNSREQSPDRGGARSRAGRWKRTGSQSPTSSG